MLVAHRAPPLPFLPPERYGRRCSGCCSCGAATSPRGCARPLRCARSAPRSPTSVRPVPYRALQSLIDGSAPRGTHAYWRSHRLPTLSDAAIERIVERVETVTSPMSLLNGWVIGGAASRVAPGATAVGEREVGFELRLIAVWPPGDPDGERHTAWVRDGWDALRPHASGRQYADVPRRRGRRRRPRSLRRPPRPPDRAQGPPRPGQRLPIQRQRAAERPPGPTEGESDERTRHRSDRHGRPPRRPRAARPRRGAVRAFVRDRDRAATCSAPTWSSPLGDFADRASLDRALEGIDRVFLACGNVPGQVELECAAIDAARAAGVQRVVKLSGPRPADDSPIPFERWHAEIERHLIGSGIPWVLLRPCTYMTNLLMHADAVRHTGRLMAPAGAAEIAFVDPRDVAACAAAALAEDGHAGSAYALTGPEAITFERIARELSAATGRPVSYVDVPEPAARQGMVEAGLPEPVADAILAVFAVQRTGAMARTSETVLALTGRGPRSVERFARDHAALFGAAELAASPDRSTVLSRGRTTPDAGQLELALDLVDELEVQLEIPAQEAVDEQQVVTAVGQLLRRLGALQQPLLQVGDVVAQGAQALARGVVADEVGHQQPDQRLGLQRRDRHVGARVVAQRPEPLVRERVHGARPGAPGLLAGLEVAEPASRLGSV